MKHIAVAVRIAVAVLTLALLGAPALAQKAPNATVQEILIKASLLTFNDANVTGNYQVFHSKLSKPFRDQFSPERFAEVFKAFRDQHIDLDLIAAKAPISVEEPKVDDDGRLTLKGYFDTTPSRVNYDLGFIMSDGEWKLIGINVDLKKPDKWSGSGNAGRRHLFSPPKTIWPSSGRAPRKAKGYLRELHPAKLEFGRGSRPPEDLEPVRRQRGVDRSAGDRTPARAQPIKISLGVRLVTAPNQG